MPFSLSGTRFAAVAATLLALPSVADVAAAQAAPRDTAAHVILAAAAGGAKEAALQSIAIRRGRRYLALRVPDTLQVAALNAVRHRRGPLTVLFHGVPAGSATPDAAASASGCWGIAARFTPAAEGPPFDGLATDAPAATARRPIVRPATFAEEKALRTFAARILRAHGVPAGAAAQARMDRAFAVTVRAGEPPSLVAGVSVEVSEMRNHGAFVVVQGRPGAYRLAYAAYTGPGRAEPETRELYDAADLDGDGTAEMVVLSSYWETSRYRILSRAAGRWRQVLLGGWNGC